MRLSHVNNKKNRGHMTASGLNIFPVIRTEATAQRNRQRVHQS